MPRRGILMRQRGILRPPRRRAPFEFQLSTVETSEPEAGPRNSAGDLHKSDASSLTEVAEHSVRPYLRKPLFCSTPSGSQCERPCSKASAATPLPAASSHDTLGHLSLFNTSQDLFLESPGHPFHAPNPATLSTLCTNVGDIPTHTTSPTLSPDHLRRSLAWEIAEDGSHFVSESAGLGSLVGALKQKCLTVPCTVPLERVERLIPGLLHTSQFDSGTAEWVLARRTTLKEECPLRKCSVLLQRLAWPQQPVTVRLRMEEYATASKCNTTAKAISLQQAHLRRSTARSTADAPSLSSPDQAGFDCSTPQPAAVPTPKEASRANTPHVLINRWTPDHGPCPTPESREPACDGPRCFSNRTTRSPCHLNARAMDPPDNPAKRQKISAAPREQKKLKKGRRERSMSKDRSGTARKACVSGLSVSRWKDQSGTGARLFQHSAQTRIASRAGDCSITELLSAEHKPSKVRNVISQLYYIPIA